MVIRFNRIPKYRLLDILIKTFDDPVKPNRRANPIRLPMRTVTSHEIYYSTYVQNQLAGEGYFRLQSFHLSRHVLQILRNLCRKIKKGLEDHLNPLVNNLCSKLIPRRLSRKRPDELGRSIIYEQMYLTLRHRLPGILSTNYYSSSLYRFT